MKITRHIFFGLLVALLFRAAAQADTETPYATIVSRNVFGLIPIPTNPPVEVVPEVPLPKITPNGIMDIFGKLQALFKVAMPAKGSQPAHDESYVLSEGEQQDEIEVTKIDKKGGMVTFSNHGQVQELPLVVGVASGGASPAGGGGAVPGMGNPAAVGQAGAGLPPNNFGGGNRFGRPNPTGLNPSANGSPNAAAGGQPNFGSPGVSANNLNNNPQAEENLAPETKVLLIEAQRLKYKAANSPVADIFPPTPLTQQLNEESGGTGGGGP